MGDLVEGREQAPGPGGGADFGSHEVPGGEEPGRSHGGLDLNSVVDLSLVGDEWRWEGDGIIGGFTEETRGLIRQPDLLSHGLLGQCSDFELHRGKEGHHVERTDGSGMENRRDGVESSSDVEEGGTNGCGFVVGDSPNRCLDAPGELERGAGDVHINGEGSGQDQQPSNAPVRNVDSDEDDFTDIVQVREDTEAAEALAEKKKRALWRKMPKKVKRSVQVPPPGPFSRADLIWESKDNVGNGKRRQTQKATIPWDRLDDFLEGEMSGRQHPCTFVEESRKCMKRDERKQIRAESPAQEVRYNFRDIL